MDLQTRKLNLIAYLAQLQDELFFEKLERIILKKESEIKSDFKPFTIEEFKNRIEKSEKDYEHGKFKSQDDLEKISSNW